MNPFGDKLPSTVLGLVPNKADLSKYLDECWRRCEDASKSEQRQIGPMRTLSQWQEAFVAHSMSLIPLMGLDGEARTRALLNWQRELTLLILRLTEEVGERVGVEVSARILEHPELQESPAMAVRETWARYRSALFERTTP